MQLAILHTMKHAEFPHNSHNSSVDNELIIASTLGSASLHQNMT